jgi:hypothetical protein
MPKLNKFWIQIQTGSEGIEEPARFCFNSHVLPLEELSGGTNTPPYSVEYPAVELGETTELNIWKDPPLPTFDV